MHSSELKARVKFERFTINKNAAGIPVESWTTLWEPRAKVEHISGNENLKNEGVQNTLQINVYVRYNPTIDIKDTDRLTFNNKTYNISCVEDVGFKNKWLLIKGVYIK